MAAPTVGTPTVAVVIDATTLVVNAPTMSNGDLLIAFGVAGDSSGRDITPPAGWQTIFQVGPVSLGPQDRYSYAWYKEIASAAGEPSSYTFTLGDAFTRAKITIMAVTGAADPNDTAIVDTSDYDSTSGTPTASPAITPTVNDSLILRCVQDGREGENFTWPVSTEILEQVATYFGMGVAKTTGGTGGVAAENVTVVQTWHEAYRHIVLAIAPPTGTPTTRPIRRDPRRFIRGRR